MPKSSKWNKWRLSKQAYPTRIYPGQKGPGSGHLSIGRVNAAKALGLVLGQTRVDDMKTDDTRGEWVFMEAKT